MWFQPLVFQTCCFFNNIQTVCFVFQSVLIQLCCWPRAILHSLGFYIHVLHSGNSTSYQPFLLLMLQTTSNSFNRQLLFIIIAGCGQTSKFLNLEFSHQSFLSEHFYPPTFVAFAILTLMCALDPESQPSAPSHRMSLKPHPFILNKEMTDKSMYTK